MNRRAQSAGDMDAESATGTATRRFVLGGAAAAFLSGAGFAKATPGLDVDGWTARLVMHFVRPGSAAEIGAAAISDMADAPKREILVSRIVSDLNLLDHAPEALTPKTLRRALSTRVRRDFAAGDVIIVEGWMLSATEIRVFALVYLAGAGARASV